MNYIYGAGALGKHILEKLESSGVQIEGFIDQKKHGETYLGKTVSEFGVNHSGATIWVGVLNNWVPLTELARLGEKFQVKTIIYPPQVFFKLGELGHRDAWYWLLGNEQEVREIASESLAFFNDKFDEESMAVLRSLCAYRCDGIVNESYVLPETRQYLDSGIDNFWGGEISILDGGAYVGDTLQALENEGCSIKRAFAFEPDSTNFSKLVENLTELEVDGVCFPAALGSRIGLIGMNALGTSGSSVASPGGGNSTALQVSVDDTLIHFEITHVKLDIEGAELEALQGMRELLLRTKPKLAISVYHKPDDLVSIPRFLASLGIYSKWSLRTFANQTFETILFVAP